MSWFASLFGQCDKVRFNITFKDGTVVEGTCSIETFNIDNAELEQNLINKVYVQTGKPVANVTILGFDET